MTVLTALCNDTDEEVVRALDARFVAPRRTVAPAGSGSSGKAAGSAAATAFATSAAGGSSFHTGDGSDAIVLTLGESEPAPGASSGGVDDFSALPSVFNDPDSVELSLLRHRVLRGDDEEGESGHRRASGSALALPQPVALGPGLSDDAGEGGGGWVRDVVDTGLRDSAVPPSHGAGAGGAGAGGKPPLARGDSGDLLAGADAQAVLGELQLSLGPAPPPPAASTVPVPPVGAGGSGGEGGGGSGSGSGSLPMDES